METDCYDCRVKTTLPKVFIHELDGRKEGAWLCFPHAGFRLQQAVKQLNRTQETAA